MTTPWLSTRNPIRDGENVQASVTNRYPDQLAQRTEYLKERLDALEAGEALALLDVALGADTLVGHLVYWDAALQEYKAAKAGTEYDTDAETWGVSKSSFVEGIVVGKSSATRGDIIQIGFMRDFNFTNTIGVPGNLQEQAGIYYLSGQHAGMAVKQSPAVSIMCLSLRGDGSAHFIPANRNAIESHVHYNYNLYAVPAGTLKCTEPHNPYEFDVIDDTWPGWLPASHPALGGSPPFGAVLGYNISRHPQLERIWPPMPLNSAYLEVDGRGVPPDQYIIDSRTIWWKSDCYGKAPWSIEPGCTDIIPGSSSSSSSSGPGRVCNSGSLLEQMGYHRGDPLHRQLSLWFVKMVAKTNESVVTSLEAAPGSPVRITGCDGITPAKTGALQVAVDLSLNQIPDQPGYNVLKQVQDTTFLSGPVVEGIRAGANILITPAPGQSIVDAEGYTKGKMTVQASLPGSDRFEGGIVLVALDKAREESINDIFMFVFPQGIQSSFRGQIDIPRNLTISSPRLELWFWILARAAGTLPVLPLRYRRLCRPTPTLCTPMELPTLDTALPDLNPGLCSFVGANRYVETTGTAFEVLAGDQVQFQLGRGVDTYTGDVGLVRMGYRIFTV